MFNGQLLVTFAVTPLGGVSDTVIVAAVLVL